MASGAVWEIFEFGMDQIFGLNMQKSGLQDTMFDLIVDALGGLFVSVLVYKYLKNGERSIVTEFVRKFEADNPRLFWKKGR